MKFYFKRIKLCSLFKFKKLFELTKIVLIIAVIF
jgi:hypothetical protein